ncbi:MAG: nucleotidyltransferase domain-containing protein, partial [Anaeroplasmataceae bacterium]|nr:nucleotidyltransferase domain-containing protein [Anaeroplasmataceae bacterium]
EYKEYEKAREEFFKGEKDPMLTFTLKLLRMNPYMDKTYYKNLKPVSLSDIIEFIEQHKEEFKNKYQIKGLWLHGSFAKKIERIDSDIDFFIEMSLDLLYEEKLAIIEELKQLFFNEFDRMIDLHEIVEYLDDDIIKEARSTKKLI